MRLSIVHHTTYEYDTALRYGVQYLRLTPFGNVSQRVMRWHINAPGPLTAWIDAFGNQCNTLVLDRPTHRIDIMAAGQVETTEADGVLPDEEGSPPVEIYLRQTALTKVDMPVADFAEPFRSAIQADRLDGLHALATAIRDAVEYRDGETEIQTPASEVLVQGSGVCQDHAHVFIACCRHLGVPARYVSGYLFAGEQDEAFVASHAWAAAWAPPLGWVSFDVANRTCGTQCHVGVALGLDYHGASPIRGIREGGEAREGLSVAVKVAQAQRSYQQ